MSRPWMPLYVADYLADTGHLSTVEHGAYFLLIMHYWQHQGLPDDDKKLSRIARLSLDEWAEARDTIAEFFEDGWRHKRIDAEIQKSSEIINKRKAAGKAGARARYGNDDGKSTASAMANATREPLQTHSHPHPHSSVTNVTGGEPPSDEQWLFGEGLEILTSRGSTEKQARGMIGKWRKDKFTDAHIRRSLEEARDNSAAEPTAYVTKVLKKPAPRDPTIPTVRREPTEAELRTATRKFKESGYWLNAYGPRPDMQSTRVPKHIRQEFGL